MIKKYIDILLTAAAFLLIMPFFMIFSLFIILINLVPGRAAGTGEDKKKAKRTLLRLCPASLDDLKKKGVLSMLYTASEDGYFGHVYTYHYPSKKTRKVALDGINTVFETGIRLSALKSHDMPCLYLFLNSAIFFAGIFIFSVFVKRNVSLIRGQDPDHMGLAAVVLHKLTGIPACVSVHADHDKRRQITAGKDVYTLFNSRAVTDFIRFLALRYSPMVLVIRESLIQYALRHGAKARDIRVIPHGIPLEEFKSPPDQGIVSEWKGSGRKIVVFAGRLYPENYVMDVIRIAAAVKERLPCVLFIILGDGVEKKRAQELSRELGLEDNIAFLGFVPKDRVIDFRRSADVNLCLMAGFSLIEAAAAARPIVSYDVEWHYELVKNGQTGYLVKENDIEAAARAIVKLMQDADLSNRLGSNAREIAFEKFSLESSRRAKINCYEELLK